jgi:hypothetical protein
VGDWRNWLMVAGLVIWLSLSWMMWEEFFGFMHERAHVEMEASDANPS